MPTPHRSSPNEDIGGPGPNPEPPITRTANNPEEHAMTVTAIAPQPTKVEFSTEIVTPAAAKAWLQLNVDNNRKLRAKKVEQYANDMRRTGGWQNNGETIKFDIHGNLIDGQHRLAAIIEAGIPVEITVVRGLQPEVMKTIDTGVARTFADVLKLQGGTDVNVTSAIVRRIMLWDRGVRTHSGGAGVSTVVSASDLLERYDTDPNGFRMAAGRGGDVRRHTGALLTSTTAGTAFYLFARIDHVAAMDFIDRFITGENLGSGHPILTLRTRLIRAKNAERLNEPEKLALTIRAWNFYRNQEPCDRLQIAGQQGLTNKTFPTPK